MFKQEILMQFSNLYYKETQHMYWLQKDSYLYFFKEIQLITSTCATSQNKRYTHF